MLVSSTCIDSPLVTVFVNIHHDCFTPTKQEVSDTGAQDDGETQPNIVGHKHQHEAVTDEHLDHM